MESFPLIELTIAPAILECQRKRMKCCAEVPQAATAAMRFNEVKLLAVLQRLDALSSIASRAVEHALGHLGRDAVAGHVNGSILHAQHVLENASYFDLSGD
jgi:hypothetical protein